MGSRRYSSPFPFANQNYNKDEISYETIQVNKLTYDDKILCKFYLLLVQFILPIFIFSHRAKTDGKFLRQICTFS